MMPHYDRHPETSRLAIASIDETDERMVIHATYAKQPEVCQVCAQRAAENKILYRCACCHGLFPPAKMDANAEGMAATRAFTDNHAAIEKAVLWCLECHTRFYLEKTTHHLSLSNE